MQFHYLTYMIMSLSTRTCAPGVIKFTILVNPPYPSLLYTLSDLCLGVEKKIFKEIMHFHYMAYVSMPKHKNPCPRGKFFTILVNPSFNYYIYSVCLINANEQRRNVLKKYTSIFQFLPQILFLWSRGHENLQFFVSLPTRCYIPKLVKTGPVNLKEKM